MERFKRFMTGCGLVLLIAFATVADWKMLLADKLTFAPFAVIQAVLVILFLVIKKHYFTKLEAQQEDGRADSRWMDDRRQQASGSGIHINLPPGVDAEYCLMYKQRGSTGDYTVERGETSYNNAIGAQQRYAALPAPTVTASSYSQRKAQKARARW